MENIWDNKLIHSFCRPYNNIIFFSFNIVLILVRKLQNSDLMSDILSFLYPWTLAFHIVSVISWMAGLFYLPRLFVHHVEQAKEVKGLPVVFDMMEYKLLRVIMNPAMIATWVFGLILVLTPGVVDWSMIWPWTKLFGVVGMSWFHHWLALRRKDLAAGVNTITGRGFRIMNEVPTVLMIVIVFSVVLKF